jgi:hypothetical protein
MALTIVNPGQYVLGGIDAPQAGIAEQFQAGLRANLERQDVQQVMKARDQDMQLRASQEARAQAQFKQQQAAAAAAAARAAEQRAATAELMKTLRATPGAPPPAGVQVAPTVRPRTVYDAPTGRQLPSDARPSFGLPAVPPAASAAPAMTPQTLGLSVPAEMMRSAGVQVASLGPQQFFTSSTEVPQVGAAPAVGGAPTGAPVVGDTIDGAQVAVELAEKLEDPTLSPEERRALSIQQNVLNFAARTGYGVLDAVTDAAALLQRVGTRAIEYGIGAPLSVVSPELGSSVFRQTEVWDRAADELARMGEIAPPISEETAKAEETNTVPITEAPWGGLQLSYGTPVQEAAAETGGAPSTKFTIAPEKLARDMEALANQKFRTEALLDFYERTGNVEAFANTLTELNNLETEQWFMGGMNVIVSMQTGDFGPLLGLMQERYAGSEVDVRPYTDGTVDIFVDGEVLTGANGGRMTWDELSTDLQSQYDTVYIQNQQAAAQAEATRAQFAYETYTAAEAETAKQIAIEQVKAQLGAGTTVQELDMDKRIIITAPDGSVSIMEPVQMPDTKEIVYVEVEQAPGQ